MKKVTSILAVFMLGLVILSPSLTRTNAASVVNPAFDVTGIWSSGGEETRSQCFQEGTEVQCISNNAVFAHYATGRYVSRNEIRLIQTRRNRSTGCQTNMEVILTVTSANTISVAAKGLDSNCDLTPGPVPAANVTRVL